MQTPVPMKVASFKAPQTDRVPEAIPGPNKNSNAWFIYEQFMAAKPYSSQLIHAPPPSPAFGPMACEGVSPMIPYTQWEDAPDAMDGEDAAPASTVWDDARIHANVVRLISANTRHIPPILRDPNNTGLWMSRLDLCANLPYGPESMLSQPGGYEPPRVEPCLDWDWLSRMELRDA